MPSRCARSRRRSRSSGIEKPSGVGLPALAGSARLAAPAGVREAAVRGSNGSPGVLLHPGLVLPLLAWGIGRRAPQLSHHRAERRLNAPQPAQRTVSRTSGSPHFAHRWLSDGFTAPQYGQGFTSLPSTEQTALARQQKANRRYSEPECSAHDDGPRRPGDWVAQQPVADARDRRQYHCRER